MCTAGEKLASLPQHRIANTYAHRNWSKMSNWNANYFWPQGYFSAPHKSNAPTLMPGGMLLRGSHV